MSSKPSKSNQIVTNELYDAAKIMIANGIFRLYFSKAEIRYGALYWPLWDGRFLFISPEDRVKGIVPNTDTIPADQDLRFLEIGTAVMGILQFQTEVMRNQNKINRETLEALINDSFFSNLFRQIKKWAKKVFLTNGGETVLRADHEISFDEAYKNYVEVFIDALQEKNRYTSDGIYVFEVSDTQYLRFNRNVTNHRFQISDKEHVFYVDCTKPETIKACHKVLGDLFEDM